MIFGLYLQSQKTNGVVVQLVRILPCHGRGRGFESRPHRFKLVKPFVNQHIAKGFFIIGTLWGTVLGCTFIFEVLNNITNFG